MMKDISRKCKRLARYFSYIINVSGKEINSRTCYEHLRQTERRLVNWWGGPSIMQNTQKKYVYNDFQISSIIKSIFRTLFDARTNFSPVLNFVWCISYLICNGIQIIDFIWNKSVSMMQNIFREFIFISFTSQANPIESFNHGQPFVSRKCLNLRQWILIIVNKRKKCEKSFLLNEW